MLSKIHFFLEQSYNWTGHNCARLEAEATVREGRQRRLQGEVTVLAPGALPFSGRAHAEMHRNTLFLADSERLLRALQEMGLYAAGYYHGDNAEENLSAAMYVVEEPQLVDGDSYEKIYERLAGIPWTILKTKRCLVREMTEQDLEVLYTVYDDPETKRFVEPLASDREEERSTLRAYIRKMYGFFGYGLWAVVDRENGRLIGRAGFELCTRPAVGEQNGAELGYLLAAPYRHRGVAQEVCSALLRYGFETLEFTNIQALAVRENEASISLLNKLGFHRVNSNIGVGKRVLDTDRSLLFVLTAQEWRNGRLGAGIAVGV
ncbi:MAG: GNAT family protein [Eubacteriales bacterium]|nr:GNAT family protein [Eubacteriales bacterium]